METALWESSKLESSQEKESSYLLLFKASVQSVYLQFSSQIPLMLSTASQWITAWELDFSKSLQ